MFQKMRNRKGFTLVELMIVVAIIGILAAIAIPNFLQFRLKAKISEAKSNLGAIRAAETAYFAEWNFYVAGFVTNGANPISRHLLPVGTRGAKRDWNPNSPFSIIGFAPEGQVYFSYYTNPIDAPVFIKTNYTINAEADLDDDGTVITYKLSGSGGEIFKVNDGY